MLKDLFRLVAATFDMSVFVQVQKEFNDSHVSPLYYDEYSIFFLLLKHCELHCWLHTVIGTGMELALVKTAHLFLFHRNINFRNENGFNYIIFTKWLLQVINAIFAIQSHYSLMFTFEGVRKNVRGINVYEVCLLANF